MDSYFYRKCQWKTNKNGKITSSALFFFHVEKLILAEWQLTIFEHKILKLYDFYQTLFRDKIDSCGVAIDYFRT